MPQLVFRQLVFLSLAVTILACTGYRPVSTYEESLGRSSGPDFSIQAFNYFTDGTPRTDLFIAINNISLQFTKDGERYVATYDVAARVLSDEGKRLVSEKDWTETVTENDYGATQSRIYHVSPRSFSLEPGAYTVAAEITDVNSKLTMERMRVLQIPDYQSSSLSFSSLMIGSHHVSRDGRQTLLPNVDPGMSYVGESQYVYYEVNDKFPGRGITLEYKLYGTSRYDFPLFSSPFNVNEPLRPLQDTLFWSHESTLTTRAATTPINLLLPTIPTGHCRLEVSVREAESPTSTGERGIRMTRVFTLWPYGFPEIATLDQQIEVLEHIATREDFTELKNAKTKEEKQQRLLQFWGQHRNRDEYYKRAEYANRYFSCISEGWRTPFGWIYMVVGTPESIQLLPGGSERWEYTLSSTRTLQFTFFIREVTLGEMKCRMASMAIDPTVRRDLVSRWRKSD
ncbi:MAG: GWxTD domain-containing protein [Bacteroidota bacterium]